MIAHVPLNYFGHKNISVLIIGGGDGGTAREVPHLLLVVLTLPLGSET